jgi:uncharacterized membrane protein
MPTPLNWPGAALAGLASSMRTMAGPALLAARGTIAGRPRTAVLLAAAGELASDKTPFIPDRTGAPAVAGRVAAGAYTGRALAGPAGLAAGAAGAAVGSFATFRARKLAADATGLPDPVIAIGEDLLAYCAAAVATRPQAAAPPDSLPGDALRGLAAGLAGTAAMTIAQGAEFVLTSAKPSDAPVTIADKIKRRAGRGKVKRRHRSAVNQGMHWLYGTSWGLPYGLAASRLDVAPEVSGPLFGMFVWAAALAHQPALGIADLPWKRSPASLGSEALFHLVYGIGAGAALRALTPAGRPQAPGASA